MTTEAIGIIGGSGLYEMDGFQTKKAHRVATPFGKPSDAIIEGRLHKRPVFFLPRHGVGHRISPTEINFRANIYALKKLGVRNVFSVSAVGSLQAKYEPGHFVLADQFVDRTKGIRKSTFFGEGCVGHVALADPICPTLWGRANTAASEVPLTYHKGGTYVCMEGPGFSTRAESRANHQAGFSVIGMTNVPEAYLAREAGLCYCTVAMVTDYDSWNETVEHVTVEAVIKIMKENVARAKQLLSKLVASFEDKPDCACRKASQFAIMTNPKLIPAKTRSALKLVLAP
ncbi:MAG: S-methyl-5'-thioadenosine phosphorylase [Deltaproteobacteria bacterium]|nr:S-methyl-5'-thioadenosine phosphorylase [Deltaproteobacteria bacterium]